MKRSQAMATKRILLVDDEAIVRKTCERMLTRMGYEVLDAPDGQQAIDLYRQHWQSISVVMLDMIMPEMNGDVIFEQLRAVNPNARVIFSSGYPQDDLLDSLSLDSAFDNSVAFVKKPFGLKELMDTVHRVSVTA